MIDMTGRELAQDIKDNIAKEIKKGQLDLSLSVILVGNNPASEKYVEFKRRACEEVGIRYKLWRFPETATPSEVLSLIKKLNADEQVTGIIVQLPLPKNFVSDELLEAIDPAKDVDGLNSVNLGRLTKYLPGLYPATAEGVINLLRYYKIDLAGKRVVVVGQSNLVGRPLAQFLLNDHATVMMANSMTKDLAELTRNSDIIVTAVGKAKLITADMVPKGAVVVDVGTSLYEGKIVGDVDYESVSKVASHLTPCVGGVGPLTVAFLLSNVLKAAINDFGVHR